jgi:hypothetical protein
MEFEAIRHSFYRGDDGRTLRYTEHAPEKPHEDKAICGCTSEVSCRPQGASYQRNAHVSLLGEQGKYKVDFNLVNPWLTLKWGINPGGLKFNYETLTSGHAYFMGYRPNALNVEITTPGFGNVDHLFANIFYGVGVDVSKLYNGHSPSRVFDGAGIKKDDIWLHFCLFGDEDIYIMETEEREKWKTLISDTGTLRSLFRDQLQTCEISALRELYASSPQVQECSTRCTELAKDLLENIKETELFRLCSKNEEREKKRYSRTKA